jgi:hypothetical protein
MTLARHLAASGVRFDDNGNVLIPGNVAANRPPSYITQRHAPSVNAGPEHVSRLFIHLRDDGSRTMTSQSGCAAGVPDRDGNAVCGCGGW